MSELEFILIGVSMVLAIALGKLLEGMVDLTGSKGRYWVHTGWTVTRAMSVVLNFWVYSEGALGRVEADWTFGMFLLTLAGPVTTFMQVHLLLTIDSDSFIDWRSHFYSIRRRFFLIAIFQQLSNLAAVLVFPIAASLPPFALLLGLSIAGLVWSNARLQGFIVCIFLAVQVVGLAIPIAEGLAS